MSHFDRSGDSKLHHQSNDAPSTTGLQQLAQLQLPTDHTLAFLHWLSLSTFTDTDRLDFSQLLRFANFQQQINPDNNQFMVVFFNKLLLPFNILAFIVLVMPFILGSNRTTNTSTKVIVAILIGLVFVNFQQITLPLHIAFGLPPLLVAVIPALSTLMFAWVIRKSSIGKRG